MTQAADHSHPYIPAARLPYNSRLATTNTNAKTPILDDGVKAPAGEDAGAARL